jgi:hypothetical protein
MLLDICMIMVKLDLGKNVNEKKKKIACFMT